MFAPTVYSVMELRTRNLASHTIEQHLRAVAILQIFLDSQEIDLDERLAKGYLLETAEIEELARLCRRPMKELQSIKTMGESNTVKQFRVRAMEAGRSMMRQTVIHQNQVKSFGDRLRSIRDYLNWIASNHLSQHRTDDRYIAALKGAIENVEEAINARIPDSSGRGTIDAREGIGSDAIARLKEVTDPNSSENPWKNQAVRYRNQLAVHFLCELGIRRGELLNIQISHIDLRGRHIDIVRSADNPADPRRNQPKAKTRARRLPISERLAQMTQDYILQYRKGKKKGLKHDFLLVANGTLEPLTLIGLNKLFEVLRAKCPDLPQNLSPHVLRHSWNDSFSEKADERKMSEEKEHKVRTLFMGWAPTSKAAHTYTRRHVREEARQISLEMQKDALEGKKNGK